MQRNDSWLALGVLSVGAMAATPALGNEDQTLLAELYQQNVHVLQLEEGRFSGPGAAWLENAVAGTQFVALGERHNNRDIPAFTTALFRLLQSAQAYQYLATEQDWLMMERISRPPLRGNLEAIARQAELYPYGFTFISDQELQMLADIGALSAAAQQPIWGAEQAFGASHYLHALKELAPDDASRAHVARLLERAQVEERAPRRVRERHYMARVQDKRDALNQLVELYAARPGSEPAQMITALLRSDEIYGYYHRAEAGEVVGLWNNWVREDWMKQLFIAAYRQAEARDGSPPRVLLKYGGWHIQRGRAPGGVFSLGGFVHELAIYNGSQALSLQLVAFAEIDELAGWAPAAAWAGLLPRDSWAILDLRPYRPYLHAGKLRTELEDMAHREFRDLAFGFDAVVFFPGSGGATFELTGADF